MSADNSTVKITIDVVDANSGAVVGQVTKNLGSMGNEGATAGEKIAAGARKGADALREAGTAGANAGTQIGRGMGEAGAHTLSNLDNVRLLRDDLGIRIPRAMEMVIARSSALSSAIGAVGSGLVALGTVEIFVRLAAGAYEFYKRVTDVNAAMQKFSEQSSKSAHDELFNNASIETTRKLLQQVAIAKQGIDATRTAAGVGLDGSGSVTQYVKWAAKNIQGPAGAVGFPGLPSIGGDPQVIYNGDSGRRAAANAAEQEVLDKREASQDRQIRLQQAQNKADLAGVGLTGAAAEAAKTKAKNDLADARMYATQAEEQYNHATLQRARLLEDQLGVLPIEQRTRVDDISPDAGKSVRDQTVQQNNAELGANLSGEARKQSEETLHVQAEARAAALQGEAKYMAERDEQLRLLKEKMRDTELSPIDYMKRVAAAEQRYAAERQKRLETEHAETSRMQAEAGAGGARGMASIDARSNAEVAGIEKSAPGFADAGTKDAREAAVRAKAQAEIAEATKNFNDRLASMDLGRADATMSTNAKIELSAKRSIAEIEKAWQEEYGQLAALDQRRVQSRTAVDALIVKTQRDVVEQERQARQTVLDETQKMELEGNRRGMTRDQEARQAILDEYAERYRHLEELRARDADNADLYRRQEIAAEEVKNGKLIEQQREMRDKLAGELRGFMNHPLDELKKLGEDAASKYAADLLLKGSTGTSTGASGGRKAGLLDLIGLGGGAHGGGKHHPADKGAVTTTTSTVSAASTALTTGSAVINISGTATFTGLSNGGGGAALPAAAALQARGKTAVAAADADYRTQAAAAGGSGASAGSTASLGASGSGLGDYGASSSTIDGSGGTSAGAGPGGIPGLAGGVGGGSTSDGTPPNVLEDSQNILGMGQSAAQLGQQLGAPDGALAGVSGLAGASGAVSGVLGAAAPYASAGAGVFSAVEGNGGIGGAFQGAMAGARLGGLLGGPLGAGIGAAAGAITGFLGIGGAQRADHYYVTTVKPRMDGDLLQYQMGAMPYQSAYDDLVNLDKEARFAIKRFGEGGKREWDGMIHPEIMKAQQTLQREQKAGRSQYGMGAAQYHDGGLVNDFGSMSTTGNQGWIHAQQGEFVMRQQAVPSHYQALSMMQAGASHSEMASYYGGSAAPMAAPASSSSDVNMHFHSHDARGTYQLFMDNKHSIREALNQSYAENSGGTD